MVTGKASVGGKAVVSGDAVLCGDAKVDDGEHLSGVTDSSPGADGPKM
jgi:hypothetical protein